MTSVKKIKDIYTDLGKIRVEGNKLGLSTGSRRLDSILSVKLGYPWFIGGQPAHGKSEVTMELLISWSQRYGWKHFCYFGEGGSVAEIVADLCSKFIGKPYLKTLPNHMDDSEKEYAHSFIDEYFDFLDLDNTETTYANFLKIVEEREREMGMKFQTVTFDPWNDVHYETEKQNVSYFLKDALRLCRIASQQNNRIDILVNHVGDTPYAVEGKHRYRPIALADEWEGGKMWPRRAFVMLNVWRPPTFLNDDNGLPYEENTVVLTVQKVKPKGTGFLGKVIWKYDYQKNRYSEQIHEDSYGQPQFREILDKDTYDRDKNICRPTLPPF